MSGACSSLPTARNISRVLFSSLLLPLVPPPALTCSSAPPCTNPGENCPPAQLLCQRNHLKAQTLQPFFSLPHSPCSQPPDPVVNPPYQHIGSCLCSVLAPPWSCSCSPCTRCPRKQGGSHGRDQSWAGESRPGIVHTYMERFQPKVPLTWELGPYAHSTHPGPLFARGPKSLGLGVCMENQCCSR